jgi:hypothetical protein
VYATLLFALLLLGIYSDTATGAGLDERFRCFFWRYFCVSIEWLPCVFGFGVWLHGLIPPKSLVGYERSVSISAYESFVALHSSTGYECEGRYEHGIAGEF